MMTQQKKSIILMSIVTLVLGVLSASTMLSQQEDISMPMTLSTSAFSAGKPIPKKYTCDDEDISPELRFENIPAGTKSITLIMDDPDAPHGTWVHWVLYDLPANTKELQEGYPKDEVFSNGAKQGMTDFRRVGYGGPCPPPGKPHRYFFKLYALDTKLNLPPKATKQEVEAKMKGHILAQAELMGTYGRGVK
jgi:Raf kinase inhibitor-like YbhB/YbcL family protein